MQRELACVYGAWAVYACVITGPFEGLGGAGTLRVRFMMITQTCANEAKLHFGDVFDEELTV